MLNKSGTLRPESALDLQCIIKIGDIFSNKSKKESKDQESI